MVSTVTIMDSDDDDMDLDEAREENEEDSTVEDDDEGEYAVEAIRDWRYNLREKRREYLVKWKGYKESEDTWEPEENLVHCQETLDKYINSLSGRRHKYWSFKSPEELSGFQRNATFVDCVGADAPHDSDCEESDKKDKQKFYCLIVFEDSDFAEEISLKEFMRHRPKDAWKFVESRMYFKQR